jgi:hypothetical protein
MWASVRWARSARKHRIARADSLEVIATGVQIREPAPEGAPLRDERIVFLGADRQGRLLEVMAVETDQPGELLVIHAMPIHRRYLEYLN